MPLITLTALSGLGTWLLKKGGDAAIKGLSPDEVNRRFEKCLLEASSSLSQKYPEAFGGNISSYLQNENIKDELFKMLFTDSNIDVNVLEQHIDFDTLPANFLKDLIDTIKTSVSTDTKINLILSNKKIYDTVKDSSISINNLLQDSNQIKESIHDIREKLNDVFKNKFSYDLFLINYYDCLKNSISDINFFGLGIEQTYKKPRVNIGEVFVKPTFRYKKRKNSTDAIVQEISTSEHRGVFYEIEANDLLKIPKNIVILGNPGAGKSLFIRAIIYSIIIKDSNLISCENLFNYIPLRIELRKYLFYKKTFSKNILNYIPHLLELEYGISTITTDDLKEILKTENVIIFFDGLDEIFDINEKYNIKNDITNFTNIYKNKSVITSRFIGYEDAKLDDNYLEFEMDDFNQEQIDEYVKKWYKVEEPDEEKRNTEVKEFSQVKGKISYEIIKNPLLLSLVVILYRNNLRIPESKLEIYQSCTKTLVHKWDSIKELDFSVDQAILDAKEVLLADLAFWQYKVLSDNPDKLTYPSALATITDSITHRLKIGEWSIAKTTAEFFLAYAEKRSIYFDNNFTHKTFLEYFTAFWIYSNCDKKYLVQKRDSIIDQYISNPFWYIVFELLLNMIDNEQSDDDIIDGIFQRQIDRDWKSLQFLLSALPSMKNISNTQIKQLFRVSIYKLIKSESDENKSITSRVKIQTEASINGTYDALSSIARNKSYKDLYIETILEIYDSSEEIKYEVFSFYYEMFALSNSNLLDIFKDHDTQFIGTIKSNPRSYMIYLYHIEDVHEMVNELSMYFIKYGNEIFFDSLRSKFANWRYVSVCQNFFSKWVQNTNKDINYCLDILSEHNLDRLSIINYAQKDGNIVLSSDRENMQNVLISLSNEKNELTQSILIYIFLSMFALKDNSETEDMSIEGIVVNIDIPERIKEAIIEAAYSPDDNNTELVVNRAKSMMFD